MRSAWCGCSGVNVWVRSRRKIKCWFMVVCLCGSFMLLTFISKIASLRWMDSPTVHMATVYVPRHRDRWILDTRIELGVRDVNGGTCVGVWRSELNKTGWDVLDLSVSGNNSDDADDRSAMFGLGYLEGYLTKDRMEANYRNILDYQFSEVGGDRLENKIRRWFDENEDWMRRELRRRESSDDEEEDQSWWRQVDALLAQLDGLHAGFLAAGGRPTDKFVVQMLNGVGEMIDLSEAFRNASSRNRSASAVSGIRFSGMSRDERQRALYRRGHCSALVKVLPGFEDILFGHSTWFSYSSMMRCYKHYDLRGLHDSAVRAKRMTFSSYAGFLNSLDDFYLIRHYGNESGLVMLQTTNDVLDHRLYQRMTRRAVPAWIRVRLANSLAENGSHWAQLFRRHNSGTYNNQYMVVDLSKIHLGVGLDRGTLTVVEQVPGFVKYTDQTAVLRNGYWASYNIPFHEDVFHMSGYTQLVREGGAENTHSLSPRAKIFRRDSPSVRSLADMSRLMRMNDYKSDPYSEGNTCATICCRGDLDKKAPSSFGCTDAKITNFTLAFNLQSWAIAGPPWDQEIDLDGEAGHDRGLPVFDWSAVPSALQEDAHEDLPRYYRFHWQLMLPTF